MRIRSLKSVLALSCGLLSLAASAGAKGLTTKASNLTYHGGCVIISPKVVLIFWGPSFATGGADHTYATTLQAFRDQFGTTAEYNVITQYSGIQLANLGSGTPDWFDTSTPPTNVTDSGVRSELNRYFSGGHGAYNSSTIYVVVLPKTSYSSTGTSTSCGGPSLAYCAYHGHYSGTSGDVKYIVLPYPSCSGCKVPGWSDVQNAERILGAEIREAVTDCDRNGWYDSAGNEADDKCAWSPTPFLSGGYGYQYEWSNACSCCVQTR
jgi:hypothetical protein